MEALTAVLMAMVPIFLGVDDDQWIGYAMVLILVPLTFIDLDHRILPNKITYPSVPLAIGADGGLRHRPPGRPPHRRAPRPSASCSRPPGCIRRAWGWGTSSSPACSGSSSGRAVAPALLIAFLLGTVVGIGVMAVKGVKAGRKTAIPFGPFLAVGGLVGLYVGDDIVDWYLDTFTGRLSFSRPPVGGADRRSCEGRQPHPQRAPRRSARPTAASAAPSAPGSTPVGAYAILGALAFAVAAMALLVLTGNDIKKNKAELAARRAAGRGGRGSRPPPAVLRRLQAALRRPRGHRQGPRRRALPLAGTRSTDISRALPEDVFISSFDGSTTTAAGGGSSLRGAIQAPSIELNGCTKDQASVARLMSRLRDVRGVTRVTLAKSEATDAAGLRRRAGPGDRRRRLDAAPTTSEPCPEGLAAGLRHDRLLRARRRQPERRAERHRAAGPTGPAGAADRPDRHDRRDHARLVHHHPTTP